MSDDSRPPVELGDCSQIDGECEDHLLSLAQAQVRGFDENAGSAQIDRLAQFAAATRNGDIDNGSCTVPRVKAAFHLNEPRVFLVIVRRDQNHYAVVRARAMHRFNLIAQ